MLIKSLKWRFFSSYSILQSKLVQPKLYVNCEFEIEYYTTAKFKHLLHRYNLLFILLNLVN